MAEDARANFPSAPIEPEVFFTRWLPAAFAAHAQRRSAERCDHAASSPHSVGVKLEGEGGGEWLLRVVDGALEVRAGQRDTAAFSLLQSVADFRGALWEGRGFALGAQFEALRASAAADSAGTAAAGTAGTAGATAAPRAAFAPDSAFLQPAALGELARLDGLLRFLVTDGPGGEWRMDLRLGPGPLPPAPDCEISVTSADAARLQTGELDPFEFLFGGHVLIRGDMTLLLQLQAIQMEAAFA